MIDNLKYERYKAIDMPHMGIYGCMLSHLNVLKLARDRGYKNILILEDDFTFLVSNDEFQDNLKQFFESNIYYNVCMISYNLQEKEKIENSIVSRVLFAQTASGYIVNSNYYDTLIELYENTAPLLIQTG
jgi:GR25 family glycosyltransferase involved in LPS biosynthesis